MGKGHNSGTFYGGMSAEHLKQYVDRLERLEEEKKNISEDIKEVFAEAKGNGFDVKTIRQILKIRKIDAAELEEAEYLLDTYKRALGMLPKIDEDEEESAPKDKTYAEKRENVIKKYPHLKDYVPKEEKDDLYDNAVAIVLSEKKVSVSYLQRALMIGYSRANSLLDIMELAGIVSAPNLAGGRELLVNKKPETYSLAEHEHLVSEAEDKRVFHEINEKELEFIESLRADLDKQGTAARITEAQLTWLQDIATR